MKAHILTASSLLLALLLFVAVACTGRHEQMQQQLEMLSLHNQQDSVLTDDSLAQALADWFDDHGTPNEQLLAHYLLGRTHADRGEAPRAVDCYLDAIAKADTTAEDCNFRVLSSVYAQMAYMFHQQLMLDNELIAHRKSCHYNYLSKDTLNALYQKKMVAGVYILQNKSDSAETILQETIRQYNNLGLSQEAILTSTMLMHLYIDKPEHQSELRRLIEHFENNSSLFDDNHELHGDNRLYYRYKGKYFESVSMLDSAEYYYGKMRYDNMPLSSKCSMFEGLLSVFHKKHQVDSIAKYAQLYCAVNDSSIVLKDQERTAQNVATYNYTRYQTLAKENSEKASQRLQAIVVISFIALLSIVSLIVYLQKKRAERQRLVLEYEEVSENYEKQLAQLRQKEESHKLLANTINEKLGKSKDENNELHHIIDHLNTSHENERLSLLAEIDRFKSKAEQIEQRIGLISQQQPSHPFFDMGIVKRVQIYAKERNKILSDNDKQQLMEAATEKLPEFMKDLNNASNITPLGKYLCLLVILNLKPGEMTHLLDISSSQVGNIKKEINQALFKEATAKTLYRNLSLRYELFQGREKTPSD